MLILISFFLDQFRSEKFFKLDKVPENFRLSPFRKFFVVLEQLTVILLSKTILTVKSVDEFSHSTTTTILNKTGTSKVGAISKAQKAQSFLNCKRGDPLDFFKSSL